ARRRGSWPASLLPLCLVARVALNGTGPRSLRNVYQFMGQQPPSLGRSRRELTGTEYDVASHGKSVGVEPLRRQLGGSAGVDPHLREVMAEARLHEGAGRRVERLTE